MISTRKLKIWIILTHAFIIIGMGHGVLTLGILEVFCLIKIPGLHFNDPGNDPNNYIMLSGLIALAGQCLIAFSGVNKQQKTNLFMYIGGLVLLWVCIVVFNISTRGDSYTIMLGLSVIPFAVCSIIAFLGPVIKKSYQWLLEKSGGRP
jgi:hypothetical protein